MLKQEARNSWTGEIGEQRAIKLEEYLRAKLEEYSNALGVSQIEIFEAWEKDRTYSAINYYQEANQPSIKIDRVKVFRTVEDMLEAIREKKFRCPSCGGISTNPYSCNSGLEVQKATKKKPAKICDWKVYGLFGDLGKGIFVYCKDKLKGENIFMPISWESN